jgi:hypothetical protein
MTLPRTNRPRNWRNRRAPLAVALALLCAAPSLGAQVRVPDDSIAAFVGVESRHLWRDITLGDAPGLLSGMAYPLRLPHIPLQLEADGWTALSNRPVAGFGDQYALTVHYQYIVADRPHPKSFIFGYTEYWNPNADRALSVAPTRTRELTAAALADIGIPSHGIRTVSLRFDAAHDISRGNATWIQAAANASIGTTIQCNETDYSLSAIPRVAVSMSNLRGPLISGQPPQFGFHSADFELDLEIRSRLPMLPLNSSTTFQFGTSVRAERLGANLGWVGLRQSFLLL